MVAVLATAGFAPVARANIVFTLTPGAGGAVSLNIAATGTTVANSDAFLLIGSATSDTFLPSGKLGPPGTAPVPALSIGGCTAQNNFYRDDNGGNGVQSLLGFFFGAGCLNGTLDLAELNGNYLLPVSVYADFIVGTYTGLVSGNGRFGAALQGLGDITLVVGAPTSIPEPGLLALEALGLLAAGHAGRRRARLR